MSFTRRQIIDAAFTELGLAPEFYDMTPGQYQTAMTRLDMMVANWQSNSVRIGYNMPATPGAGDLDDDTGVPDTAIEVLSLGLALRIAPSFGKQLGVDTRNAFREGWQNLVQNATSEIPELQMPKTLPLGAGTKPWRLAQNPFAYPPRARLEGGASDVILTSPSDAAPLSTNFEE